KAPSLRYRSKTLTTATSHLSPSSDRQPKIKKALKAFSMKNIKLVSLSNAGRGKHQEPAYKIPF
ncbi:hypothetical protein ARQ76_16245, partial [Listeria monocytogenes]|nr:hypothetical protein [Listeria monocytogenes]